MPLAVMASVGCLRRSVIEVHHSCLALLAGRCVSYDIKAALVDTVFYVH